MSWAGPFRIPHGPPPHGPPPPGPPPHPRHHHHHHGPRSPGPLPAWFDLEAEFEAGGAPRPFWETDWPDWPDWRGWYGGAWGPSRHGHGHHRGRSEQHHGSDGDRKEDDESPATASGDDQEMRDAVAVAGGDGDVSGSAGKSDDHGSDLNTENTPSTMKDHDENDMDNDNHGEAPDPPEEVPAHAPAVSLPHRCRGGGRAGGRSGGGPRGHGHHPFHARRGPHGHHGPRGLHGPHGPHGHHRPPPPPYAGVSPPPPPPPHVERMGEGIESQQAERVLEYMIENANRMREHMTGHHAHSMQEQAMRHHANILRAYDEHLRRMRENAGWWPGNLAAAATVPGGDQEQPPQRDENENGGLEGAFVPPVDVFDDAAAGAWVLHIALPGAKKEDVELDWDARRGRLRVSGAVRRPGDEAFLGGLIEGERRVGRFSREIPLPPAPRGGEDAEEEVDGEGITARMEDGLLIVTVPKVERDWTEVRKVDIE